MFSLFNVCTASSSSLSLILPLVKQIQMVSSPEVLTSSWSSWKWLPLPLSDVHFYSTSDKIQCLCSSASRISREPEFQRLNLNGLFLNRLCFGHPNLIARLGAYPTHFLVDQPLFKVFLDLHSWRKRSMHTLTLYLKQSVKAREFFE